MDGQNMNSIRQLTEAEFNWYCTMVTSLDKLQGDMRLFQLVELNGEDFLSQLNHYRALAELNPDPGKNVLNAQFLDLNRLVLNFLSAVRTYLDHTETRLSRKYGQDSPEYTGFKSFTAAAFDGHFSYRFFSKLRNFAQHCGLPAGGLTLTSKIDGISLNVDFVSHYLISNFDSWGATIKKELQEMPERFDIVPLMQEKISLLRHIDQQLQEIILPHYKAEGEALLELFDEAYHANKGIPCLFKIYGPEETPTFELYQFPFEMLAVITGAEFEFLPATV